VQYNLKMNETHAQVLVDALEIYARLGMGQIEEILEHPDLRTRIWGSRSALQEPCRRACKLLIKTVFDLPANTYYSISSKDIFDSNRVAYDLLQVIQHRLVWDRAGNPLGRDRKIMFGPIYDDPTHYSTKEPLPSIDRLPSEA